MPIGIGGHCSIGIFYIYICVQYFIVFVQNLSIMLFRTNRCLHKERNRNTFPYEKYLQFSYHPFCLPNKRRLLFFHV